MKKTLAVAGIGAAIAIGSLVGAGTANANPGYATVVTRVNWGRFALRRRRSLRRDLLPGDYAGGWSEWLQYAGPGQSVGVDPNMGANTWVSCTVYVNGRLDYADYASRGDGTDANCEWVMGPSYYPPSQLNRAV